MFSARTLLSLILLASALPFGFASPAQTTEVRRTCGTQLSREEIIAAEKHFQEHKVAPRAVFDPRSQQAATVNVYWHVISKDTTVSGGNIPDSQIANQIDVMNQAFSPTGITWVLAGTDRTVNPDWFSNTSDGSSQEAAMKKALRKGGVADLNVYSASISNTGYSTFPRDYSSNPIDDGTVLRYDTLPGGTAPFNQGKSLVHEAGHWVGLYHTFEGGCGVDGDYVDDTPSEYSPSYGCPHGRDSCPRQPGLDPINNYMDFSDDACRNQFTPGQITRMRQQLGQYRGLQV